MNVHFMSEKDNWETPQKLFDLLNAEFGFTLDPCASAENAKCARFFTSKENGLLQSWANEIVFMNPPYGRGIIGQWIAKAYQETEATVVCLLPSRTDTKWWHKFCMKASEIMLLTYRLEFVGSNNKAPFPAALVVFNRGRANTACTLTAFGVGGRVFNPLQSFQIAEVSPATIGGR